MLAQRMPCLANTTQNFWSIKRFGIKNKMFYTLELQILFTMKSMLQKGNELHI